MEFVRRYLEQRERCMRANVRLKMGMDPEEEGRRAIEYLIFWMLGRCNMRCGAVYPAPAILVHVPPQIPFEPLDSSYYSLDNEIRHQLENINELLVKINNILVFKKADPMPSFSPIPVSGTLPLCECGLQSQMHYVSKTEAYFVCSSGIVHPTCNFMERVPDSLGGLDTTMNELSAELTGFYESLRALYCEIVKTHSSYYSSEEDFKQL